VKEFYDWDYVVDRYEICFQDGGWRYRLEKTPSETTLFPQSRKPAPYLPDSYSLNRFDTRRFGEERVGNGLLYSTVS